MNKKIGYRAIIQVNGFHDAKDWIYRAVRAGVVKCASCDKPATRVWWNDAAEWYPECPEHYEPGEMWTGSTRWYPRSFGLRVFKDAAKAWRDSLPETDRTKVKIIQFDATDWYELMTEDYWKTQTEHYFRGRADFEGYRVWCRVIPLVNGEFCYELNSGHLHRAGGTSWGYGMKGAWATIELAIDAAKVDAKKRGLIPEDES